MSVSSSSSSSSCSSYSSPSGVRVELASAWRCLYFLHRRRKKLVGLLAHAAMGKEEEEDEEDEEDEEMEGLLVVSPRVLAGGGRRVGRLEVGCPVPGDAALSVRCRRRFIVAACVYVCVSRGGRGEIRGVFIIIRRGRGELLNEGALLHALCALPVCWCMVMPTTSASDMVSRGERRVQGIIWERGRFCVACWRRRDGQRHVPLFKGPFLMPRSIIKHLFLLIYLVLCIRYVLV